MNEITWIIDAVTSALLVEGLATEEASALAGDLLPLGQEFGCARPLTMLPPPAIPDENCTQMPCLRVAGYYHHSLVEGPGRRSSLLVVGCSLACSGCWATSLHPGDAGVLVPVDRLADALLDPAYQRDGISILGGEPMQQCEGLLALVQALRSRGCPHIVCYSGYTYERLRRMAQRQPAIGAVLDTIHVLIDGPFVQALADRAGPWTGSQNQRVIDLVATQREGRVVLMDQESPGDMPRGRLRQTEQRTGEREAQTTDLPHVSQAPPVDVQELPTGSVQEVLPQVRLVRSAGRPEGTPHRPG